MSSTPSGGTTLITAEQFASLQIGTPKQQVMDALGKQPENAQELVQEGIFDENEKRSSCSYYNRLVAAFIVPKGVVCAEQRWR